MDATGKNVFRVGTLKALDMMGENALIGGANTEKDGANETAQKRIRSATVVAEGGAVQILGLHREDFYKLCKNGIIDQDVLQRVKSVQVEREKINAGVRKRNTSH